jgi:hypothetical protein
MKANREFSRDESDDALDRAILAAKSHQYPPEVKNCVIEKAAAFTPSNLAWNRYMSRRTWRILASAVPVIVAACVIVFLLLPTASVGWEDVVKTIKSQKWIRATYPFPERKQAVMWLSPERQVWALQTDNWFVYFAGRRQEKYEYHTGQKQIVKMPLSQEDAQRILPVDYMSQGSWLFGNEKLISQKRREITEAGKTWIDFEIKFHRVEYYSGTLRVDPETRLPVYMILASSKDGAKPIKCTFDYPADGPADIYALGVPAKIEIDDRMPPEDYMKVIHAMAASRERIGDFRLIVAVEGSWGPSQIVWRKGDKWRIDMCKSEQSLPPHLWGAKPPDGLGWGEPIAEQLKLSWISPNYICDGRMVYQNTQEGDIARFNDPKAKGPPKVTWQAAPQDITPQALLSGGGDVPLPRAMFAKIASLVYPDLTPKEGWGFEFVPHLPNAPGCVLIKQSALGSLGMRNHWWYYIDPAKGCAVERIECFSLPPDKAADPSAAVNRFTHRMEDFQQSPQGFWYPKLIHYENSSNYTLDKDRNPKMGSEVIHTESTVHYHFDCDVALPDSLFIIDHPSEPKK